MGKKQSEKPPDDIGAAGGRALGEHDPQSRPGRRPAEDAEEQKNRIVDECISELSPRCAEILTLFYYKGMSLDQIMEQRAEKNTSKNGLKTAKNKCMNTLRDRITVQFKMFNLTA